MSDQEDDIKLPESTSQNLHVAPPTETNTAIIGAACPGLGQTVNKQGTPSPADCDAIHGASRRGDLEEVWRILSTGDANINCRGRRGMTPVMTAAGDGHRDVVELLVSKGADVSLVDGDGNNFLYWACVGGHVETVKFVLSLNVVDIDCNVGKESRTPVLVAAVCGHRDVVELLVSKGADVSLEDDVGNNILHWACHGGHVETVMFVLSLNVVDMNAKNNIGWTATDMARSRKRQRVVDLLLSRGAQ